MTLRPPSYAADADMVADLRAREELRANLEQASPDALADGLQMQMWSAGETARAASTTLVDFVTLAAEEWAKAHGLRLYSVELTGDDAKPQISVCVSSPGRLH